MQTDSWPGKQDHSTRRRKLEQVDSKPANCEFGKERWIGERTPAYAFLCEPLRRVRVEEGLTSGSQVEGPHAKGTVNVHMVRPSQASSYEYKTLSLEVPGHPTVYVRNADAEKEKGKSRGLKFLGIEWTK